MANRVMNEPTGAAQDLERVSILSQVRRKVAATWHQSQIGHRSEYSVERLLAFQDYHERTSLSRAIAVCALSPIPALLAALAIDCIPLKAPSDGWQANYAVWIRLFLAMGTEAFGVVCQMRAVIDPGTISNTCSAVISIGTAACSVLSFVLLAVLWRFPVPFGYVLAINPFVIFFSLFTVLVVGPRVLIQCPTLRKQFKAQFIIIVNQGIVAICYPIFSAIFNGLSGIQQTAFIFVMPIIKFFTKQNIANAAKNYHEYVAPVVVFSVDLFNVYYVAICMQSSKSIATTLIIMATDGFHVILALRDIFHRNNSVHTSESSIDNTQYYLRDLPRVLQKACQDETAKFNHRIRLYAPFPLPLSIRSRDFMNEFSKTSKFANDTATTRRCSTKTAMKRNSGIEPARSASKKSAPTFSSLKEHEIVPTTLWQSKKFSLEAFRSGNISEKDVLESLQTLFHSEYVLLAEYIEFMVPILYSLYLSVLFHLPIAAYYPHSASMTIEKLQDTVTNILIYAVIEFASFGALLVLLKRKFGFSPLYQLAFVLETQASALQGHLFTSTASSSTFHGAFGAFADARDDCVAWPHELHDLAFLRTAQMPAEDAAASLFDLDAVVAANGLALVSSVEQVAH
ncbi:hypothetical protein L915_11313 [Phytophthora nicotianae]|uniref:Uncharacterized protein n=1 Tax=Phytophthora nicotianae TaxID=4792 RepID=W2GME3_PHYNI|nr:hypothetical protein L915_11313 [Phytophthora nicotianae]